MSRRSRPPSVHRASALALALLGAATLGCGGASPAASAAPPPRRASTAAAATARPAVASPALHRAVDDERSHLAAARVAAGGGAGDPISEFAGRPRPSSAPPRPRRSTGPAPVERPQVEPLPFRISDLPTAILAAPLPAGAPLPAVPPTEPAPELVVAPNTAHAYRSENAQDRSMLIQIKDGQLAQIRVGPWVGWSGGVYGSSGGAYVRCGRGGGIAPWVPARWEALRVRADGAEYTVADGWFDRSGCRAATSRRSAASVRPIGRDAVVFAARVCESAACDKPSLMLLMPRAQSVVASGVGGEATKEVGAFTRVTLPLRRGGGGSVMARISTPDLLAWRSPQPIPAAADQVWSASSASSVSSLAASMLVGVEVVQGVDDDDPVAIIYQQPRHP